MKKSTLIFLVSLIFVSACKQDYVIKSHGISYLEKREKLITINKSNKNDTVKVLGQPATKGMTNDNLWIYIERTKTRGKLTKMGRAYLEKNNVLVLEFNKFGILIKKDFYDKDNKYSCFTSFIYNSTLKFSSRIHFLSYTLYEFIYETWFLYCIFGTSFIIFYFVHFIFIRHRFLF